MIVGIQSEILRMKSLGLLDLLLCDKTAKGNIMWATDAYRDLGERYERDRPIAVSLITGENSGIIKNRARKELEQQSSRTRQHAEVFTPLWICKKMNDFADADWFYKNNPQPFDSQDKIKFPSRTKWYRYVDSRRLEITCGEAPYLVSRYDVSTGESVPIQNRVGILDRKLRIVNENCEDEAEWMKWAVRAFQSIYGYEFQGDNLLIARLNLYMTFEEYLQERWKRKPTEKESRTIANIIAWNIWQMDGLKDALPYADPGEINMQTGLFDVLEDPKERIENRTCKIYDWRRDNSLNFKKIKEGGNRTMKFDFIIGNPPYQEDTADTSDKPIYNLFMDNAYQIADKVELITPARFLFNAGKTPKAWNQKMLEDAHFKVLHFEQDSSKIFPNTDITGGIAITYHNATKYFGAIEVYSHFDELNSIRKKVTEHPKFSPLSQVIHQQNKFNLDKLYEDYPEYREKIGSCGTEKRLTTKIFEQISVFKDSKSQESEIEILGLIKNRRVSKFIDRRYILRSEDLDYYKVIIPASNGSGAIGGASPTPLVGEPLVGGPLVGYTQTFIGIGIYKTREEAEAALKYVKSTFARTMLGILKITQHNHSETWRLVPLQDFTADSDIDWTKSVHEIDLQLYKKYGLSEEETAFIESHVREMA